MVVAQPDSNGRPYRVRFPDGTEGVVAPDDIDVRAHLQRAGLMVELDEERKAALVSNLRVVLCSEHATQPVVNTGSLYQ